MRASALEFRLRVVIFLAIIVLGFWAPWIQWFESLGLRRTSLLEWLALELSRLGVVGFNAATPMVIVLASLIAAVGAWLRVWGTAYLGHGVVSGASMSAGEVMASGPYRYVRNPLYIGSLAMIAAMAFAMPVSGAVFTLVLAPLFVLRLILGEEKFLTAKLGEPYQAYLRSVPRMVPLLRTVLPQGAAKARWSQATLAEIGPIGVLLITATLWWRYDSLLMGNAFAICFAVSLAVRGLRTRPVPTALALVCFAVLMEVEKLPWLRAALISLGLWLVLRAVFAGPRKTAEQK